MALRARDAGAMLQELLGRRRCPEICVQYSCGHSQEAQVTLPPVLQKKEGRLNGRTAAQVLKTQFKRCDRGRSVACGGACTGAATTTAGGAAATGEDDLALQFQVEIPPGCCCECARLGLPEEERGERSSLRCGGALVDLPSNGERGEEAIPVGVGARQMLQWLQAPPQAKPQRVALLGLRPEVAGGDLACSVSDCVREATGWSPIVLAGLVWLVGCVAYGFRQVPGDPSVNPDLLYEQFQRRIHDIPVPQQSPQYEQYRQYYLQQYEQHLQEHGALQEQWQQTRPVFNWQALLHSLGVGVLIFAAALAYCEYHYGTISFWMELAEEFWCNCQERWSKPRDPLGDSQRMERFLRELGEEEKPAATAAAAPSMPSSSSPVAASRPAPREEKRRPEPTQTDPRNQASPSIPPVPLPPPTFPLPKQPVLSGRAPKAVSARKEQSPSSGITKQHPAPSKVSQLQSTETLHRPSTATKAAGEPMLPAETEEPLREPSPERSQAQDTAPDDHRDEGCSCAASGPQPTSWPGHMWEAAAAAAAGQVWEDPAGPAVGSSRLGSNRPVQDGSGNNVRERLRRKVIERNKEHIRSAVSRVIEPLPPTPKQEEKRAVSGTELLREAEELFCQLEAESLLKQLAEEEERKKTSARKKAAKRKAAKGTEPGPEGSSVGEDPKQAACSNSDDGSQVIEYEFAKSEEAEEAKTTTVGSEESCPEEDNTHSETPPSSEVHSTPVQDTVETEEGNVLRYLAEILEDGSGEIKQELMKVATNARRRRRERNAAQAPPAADRPVAATQAAPRRAAVPLARNYQDMQQRPLRSTAGQSRIIAGKPRRPFLPPAPTWQAPQAPEVEVEQPTTPSTGMADKVSTRVKNTFLEFEDKSSEDETLNRQGNRVRASSLPCMRSKDLLDDFDSHVKVEGAKFGKASVCSQVAATCEATLPSRVAHDSRRAAEGTSRNKATLTSQHKEMKPNDNRGKQSLMNSARDRRNANRLGVWDDLPPPALRPCKETSRLGVWDDPPRRPTKATKPDADDRPDPNLGQMFSPRGGRAAGAVLLRALRGDDDESNGGPDAKAQPRPRTQLATTIKEDGASSEVIWEERNKLEVHEDQQELRQEDTSPLSARAGTLRAEAPEFVPAPAFATEQSMAAGMPVQMVPWQMVSMPLSEALQLVPMPAAVPGLVLPPLNLPLPEPGLASGEATPSPRDLADDMLTQQMEMLRFRLETEQAMITPCSEAMITPCSEAMLQSCGEDALQLCGGVEE